MARLPRKTDLGALPPAKTGRPIATYDTTAIGKGVQDLGSSIARIGVNLAEHQKAAQKYDTEARFQDFKWQHKQNLDQSIFDATPDQANGFADNWASGYKETAQQFLDGVPDSLKPEYHAKLKATERQYFREAALFARNEQKRSALRRLDELKTAYLQRSQSGEPLQDIQTDFSSLVDANPYLSGIDKATILQKSLGDFEIANVQARWERENDPDAVMRDLGGVLLDTDTNPELRAQPSESAASNDNQAKPVTAFSKDVNDAISQAAQNAGVDPQILSAFARIESSGRADARTGSYKGLFQLSDSEFEKYGGGDIYDPADNARAAAQKLKAEAAAFEDKHGRAPSPLDLYLMHQQGEAGYDAHLANPEGTAWENIRPYYTDAEAKARGFKDGDAYAKAVIWGNIPKDVRKQFPSGVDEITSADFVDLWKQKVARFGSKDTNVVELHPDILSKSYNGPYKNIPAEARLKLMQTFQSEYRNQRRAASILNGTLPVDPGNKEDRDTIDKAFESTHVLDNLEHQDWQASDYLAQLAKTTSYIPERAVNTLRGMAVNGTPEDRHYAYQTLGRIMRERPGALQTSGGENFNKDLHDEVETFNTMVMDIGIPPEQAIARIDEMRSPEFKARQQSLRTEANDIVKDLAIEDITSEYGGWFTSRPQASGSDRRASFMLDAYRDLVRYHYIRSGDPELAKKVAINEMKKAYNVSTVTGNKRLMRNRPEDYYPPIQTAPDEDPSYDYFKEDLRQAVNEAAGRLQRVDTNVNPELRATAGAPEQFIEKGTQIPLEDIFIEATSQTNADIASGNPYPSYSVVWRQEDENGIPAFMTAPAPFYVDVKAALTRQAELRRSSLTQSRNQNIRDKAAMDAFTRDIVQTPSPLLRSLKEQEKMMRSSRSRTQR